MENARKYPDSRRKSKEVEIIVQRAFIGSQSLVEAFIPVICEDIRKKIKDNHTLDNGSDVL